MGWGTEKEGAPQKVPELPRDPLESFLNTNLNMHEVKLHKVWQTTTFEEKITYKPYNCQSARGAGSCHQPEWRDFTEHPGHWVETPEQAHISRTNLALEQRIL